jgi:hypothetical protein
MMMIFFFLISSQSYFINKSSNKSQDNTQFNSNFVPHGLYVNVLVMMNLKHVKSLAKKKKISQRTQIPNDDDVFKKLNKPMKCKH